VPGAADVEFLKNDWAIDSMKIDSLIHFFIESLMAAIQPFWLTE
jgi:hypothetical protein